MLRNMLNYRHIGNAFSPQSYSQPPKDDICVSRHIALQSGPETACIFVEIGGILCYSLWTGFLRHYLSLSQDRHETY